MSDTETWIIGAVRAGGPNLAKRHPRTENGSRYYPIIKNLKNNAIILMIIKFRYAKKGKQNPKKNSV